MLPEKMLMMFIKNYSALKRKNAFSASLRLRICIPFRHYGGGEMARVKESAERCKTEKRYILFMNPWPLQIGKAFGY